MAKQKENTQRINIFLTPTVIEKLKQLSDAKGTTVSGLIRMIVLEYLQDK